VSCREGSSGGGITNRGAIAAKTTGINGVDERTVD
jgi:hypothetical protein